MEKMSLYKFTHTPLLKNDGQLIQKSDKQPKKKNKHSPNLLKNKNHVHKKKNSCLVKEKKKRKTKQLSHPRKKKKKKRSNFHEKKNAMCLAPKKEAEILFSSLNFHPILTLVPTF